MEPAARSAPVLTQAKGLTHTSLGSCPIPIHGWGYLEPAPGHFPGTRLPNSQLRLRICRNSRANRYPRGKDGGGLNSPGRASYPRKVRPAPRGVFFFYDIIIVVYFKGGGISLPASRCLPCAAPALATPKLPPGSRGGGGIFLAPQPHPWD